MCVCDCYSALGQANEANCANRLAEKRNQIKKNSQIFAEATLHTLPRTDDVTTGGMLYPGESRKTALSTVALFPVMRYMTI